MEHKYPVHGTNASTIAYMSTMRSASGVSAFGVWLRSAIAARGMTQNEFAKAIDASKSTVSRWINGDQPKGDFVERIADVLVLDYDIVATRAGYRPRELLEIDPSPAEAKLLPYIRAIDWSKHDRELAMIQRQLEFIAEVDRGEHDLKVEESHGR